MRQKCRGGGGEEIRERGFCAFFPSPPLFCSCHVGLCLMRSYQQSKVMTAWTDQMHMEGDMGVYGIAVLRFFSCGISVISILTCGIAVSSSSAVCGFSSFRLTVFGEIRLFTVLRYRLFALSFRYETQNETH